MVDKDPLKLINEALRDYVRNQDDTLEDTHYKSAYLAYLANLQAASERSEEFFNSQCERFFIPSRFIQTRPEYR
jgi:hypothetical protein